MRKWLIALLILISSSALNARSISNRAEVTFLSGNGIESDVLSNVVQTNIEKTTINYIYPSPEVYAVAKGDSIVVGFKGAVNHNLSDTQTEFKNNMSFYFDTDTGLSLIKWGKADTYSWSGASGNTADTLFINFSFKQETRFILRLDSLKDLDAAPISDTNIVFYTMLDNSESAMIFRRDKLGDITEAALPANALNLGFGVAGNGVVRIKLPKGMQVANDFEEKGVITGQNLAHINTANNRARNEGLQLLDKNDYKAYREFNYYISNKGKWSDYFDSNSDGITDSGVVFSKDATIRLPYRADKLPAGITAADLKVYVLTHSLSLGWYWQVLPYFDRTDEDTGGYFTAKVPHFSIYTIIGAVSPSRTQLYQNWPNPFNPNEGPTKIEFDLARGGYVTAEIYTVLGERVKTLKHNADYTTAPTGAGRYYADMNPQYPIYWDGMNDHHKKVASGLYILRFVFQYADGSKTYEKYMKIVVER